MLQTNATLERDLKTFEDDGGNIKKAKEFNNVIRKSFIPLDLQKASFKRQVIVEKNTGVVLE